MYSAKLVITAAAFGMWAFSADAVSIDPTAAMASVGRTATVCGVVASADYMAGSRANPTFLTVVNPDQPDPKAALTAVIYGHDRAKFAAPETMLQGQRVCVTGYISFFRGRPEMILSSPSQLSYSGPPSVAQLR
ncbi:MAG: DNA-binding protein [Alphaproteobacteria bacterium]|nr:DNA-binding protein [Alphaproteobacteria bacterium]